MRCRDQVLSRGISTSMQSGSWNSVGEPIWCRLCANITGVWDWNIPFSWWERLVMHARWCLSWEAIILQYSHICFQMRPRDIWDILSREVHALQLQQIRYDVNHRVVVPGEAKDWAVAQKALQCSFTNGEALYHISSAMCSTLRTLLENSGLYMLKY